MHRAMSEISASQKSMLISQGKESGPASDAELGKLYQKHFIQIQTQVDHQANVNNLDVSYNKMVSDPNAEINNINQFFDGLLDKDKMLRVINPNLYRQCSYKDFWLVSVLRMSNEMLIRWMSVCMGIVG